jgi:DNA mismatch repair protein MutS
MILLITGPNMAGKSTYIRQVALITLLAQVGSFVPAESAEIGMTDRIFARVGASDELSRGQSTFMVEMVETARILNTATSRSLVILDEIGRGTSTYDGLSLAWAITEHLHEQIGCRTLFATHYHELTQLEESLPRVANLNVAVKEWNDEVVFLHRIVRGGADKSYGIHVARLAGIPAQVNERAKDVLAQLEADHRDAFDRPTIQTPGADASSGQYQLTLFGFADHPLLEEVQNLDVNAMTPIEAMQFLQQAQEKLRRPAKP